MDAADRSIAALARRQHGAFTAAQAREIGLTEIRMRSRVTSGRWERAMRGVYVLAGVAPTFEQRVTIAQLSRPGSVVSHLTAAALAGLDVPSPPRPSLTVPPGSSGRSPVARLHRLDLPDHLVERRGSIVCTTMARTLADGATLLGPRRLAALVDEAMHRRATTVAAVKGAMAVTRHLRGPRRAALEAALEVWSPRVRPGSPAEARLLRQIVAWGLPEPERQITVRDASGVAIARLDGGWPDRRLGFEYDSVRWHGPAAWASDEARHGLVTSLGWRLEHIDRADVGPGSFALRDRLRSAYAAAGAATDGRERLPHAEAWR